MGRAVTVAAAVAAALCGTAVGCNTNATSCGDCVSIGGNQCIWAEGLHAGMSTNTSQNNMCTTKTGACTTYCSATLPANHSTGDMNQCQTACNAQPCEFASSCKQQTCLVSAKTLWIIVGSVVGAVILVVGCSCYCWCRKRNKRILDKKMFGETRSMAKQRKKRERRQEARKNDRDERTAAIREKYGLAVNEDDDELLEDGRDDGW
mmetsp:Transcript_15758/g.40770  ORF Transcript_15758/g.40770 Transcript_15758/m.40770 type:complete len:206 (-) Transcript_15758:171-788(-)